MGDTTVKWSSNHVSWNIIFYIILLIAYSLNDLKSINQYKSKCTV